MARHEGLIEQATYSGGRYLYWITIPILCSDSWQLITLASLMNLFTMMLYSSIIGGPVFFKLAKGSAQAVLDSYSACQAVIAITSLIGPIIYLTWTGSLFKADWELLLLIIGIPWISTAADWGRKTNILLHRTSDQGNRNSLFIILWSTYAALAYFHILPISLTSTSLAFITFNAVTYLAVRGTKIRHDRHAYSSLPSFETSKHYALAGIVAYATGNALFWIHPEAKALNDFVVIRNYLTPVLLLSLFLESHGAIRLSSPGSRQKFIYSYCLSVALLTIFITIATYLAFNEIAKMQRSIANTTYLLCAATVMIIALIKLPTTTLRVEGRDKAVSISYLLIMPIWPIYAVFDIGPNMPFKGLELLLIQYVVLLAILGFIAKPYMFGRADSIDLR